MAHQLPQKTHGYTPCYPKAVLFPLLLSSKAQSILPWWKVPELSRKNRGQRQNLGAQSLDLNSRQLPLEALQVTPFLLSPPLS